MAIEIAPDEGAVTKRDKLESIVYQAVGAASMCWEHVENAGIFQDDKAKEVSEALLKALEKLDREYRFPAEDVD